MKTTLKILIIVLILIILVVSAFLIISLLSANPYKTEIRYKPLALQSINYEIPDFWREYVEEPQVYYTRYQQNSIVFEDSKDYISMVMLVKETDWNQTFLEDESISFLNSSVSLAIAFASLANRITKSDTCTIKCKQEVYDKFKIKDFSESSSIKEKFDTCVKECSDNRTNFHIEDYGASKSGYAAKKILLDEGSLFIGEALGLNCYKNKTVKLLFIIDTKKVLNKDSDKIVSHITDTIRC